jgi:heat shock protein HslJ
LEVEMIRFPTLAALMLAACSAATGPSPDMTGQVRSVTFACEDGARLAVSFHGGTATLTDPQGRAFHLAQQETGSGILYSGEGQTLRGKGEEMTWTAPDGTPRACSAAHGPLVGTRWRLVEFRSSDAKSGTEKPSDPARYVLELLVGGRLAAQLDCNRATGRWEAHPTSPTSGSISLAAPAMTSAACLPGSWDTRLAHDLALVRSFTLDGDRLTLALQEGGGVYTWRRMSP